MILRHIEHDDLAGLPDDFLAELRIIADRSDGAGGLWVDHRQWAALRLRHSPRGLGDAVALVLHPAARAVDALLGTDMEHCAGCQERQAKLNEFSAKLLT